MDQPLKVFWNLPPTKVLEKLDTNITGLITPQLVTNLQDMIPLAPDHLPQAITAIQLMSQLYPDLPQVACFDTAFHRHMPRVAQLYALPRELLEAGVERYGFHGLSYEYIMYELGRLDPKAAQGSLIIAHLGNGASMAAVRGGLSLDTTMGFTPTGGLVMSIRSGDLDPGVLLYLLQAKHLTPDGMNELLNQKSGMLEVSGSSGNMQELLEKETTDPQAGEAVELFSYQARKFIGALTTVLGGLDTLVFTGGIGEHAAPHQGPGLIDTVLSKKGSVARIYLPPDANCLLSVADHCFRSRNYVNLTVLDKQPQLQWLNLEAARDHCARGAGIWQWASNIEGDEPEVVLGSAGDTPTLEIVAAAWWLRQHVPDLKVRVVNVVDLMALFPAPVHPHGMDETTFTGLFTTDKPVIFAFHGSPRAIHEIIHGRTKVERFHLRGFIEEGTTTTPFDMVVRNAMSRYHLCIQAIRRVARLEERATALIAECEDMLAQHAAYVREYFEDMPQVRDWVWTEV